ncbi:peptidoglycan/xylan/chitin deacetylase (PgdA/CDA1 family) [Paenibacillus shirakamiensis]|uniref:Peptidoglycan/xylan/chitin deacetylase (PgdA/CDA1 family) n=1 Tax=Paenibacillus shirakamiensis TaxID=1265935 RepID=A0ABS4JBF0_9BACL|nr:polysaccharide deacetylase family protein [Paenibacillus shirakamiensis]MBP1999039.1 peptidoglycan/xylan/chitin deacetylase (PgdA/CDA1 family) [Paenibacillus shirakamiensis]
METLLLWLFYISTLYAFIPGMISRMFGFRVFRKGRTQRQIALTFDDGPDPLYTPQLLDLLKQFDAKATFFVVGSNAERYPEIIKRIHEEGHQIGIHNYVHKTNWLMRPAMVKKQIAQTDHIIHQITGERTYFYRPPWGIVNLFDFSKKNDTQIVLWSSMFGDWRYRVGTERLTRRMLKKLSPGEIFLLHDCGATLGANRDAPSHMLEALEHVLHEASKRGLRSIRIDEMIELSNPGNLARLDEAWKSRHKVPILPWYKKVLVFLWLVWEKIFHLVFHLETTNEEDPIFHFRSRSYQGEAVVMQGGARLEKGDRVLELHFDNKKLFEIGSRSKSTVQLAIQMIRGVEKTLPELAAYIRNHPELGKIKALYGVSMLNRGPEQFGFTVADLPKGFFALSSQLYLKLLMRVIHPGGNQHVRRHAEQLVPKLIVMPTDLLLSRFADKGSHRPIANHVNDPEGLEATIPC